MTEAGIVRFLHSRFGTVTMMAVAVVTVLMSFLRSDIMPITGSNGLGLPSANEWLGHGAFSLAVNVLINVAIALLMLFLNRSYNISRSVSALFAGMFFVLQMPFPSLFGQFYGGTLLCLIVVFSTATLFSSFNRSYPLQPVFLIFFLLAAGAFTQYAYLFYLPVFLLGCAQMRIFNVKTVLAAGMGAVTPLWILWGFGIIGPDDFSLPGFRSILSAIGGVEAMQMFVSVGVTLLLCLIFGSLNLIRVFNYNAQTRSYNGFLSLLSIATALFVFFDYSNLIIYIPMLNCCTAFQIGHFFSASTGKRSYIAILGIIMLYVTLYLWTLWV